MCKYVASIVFSSVLNKWPSARQFISCSSSWQSIMWPSDRSHLWLLPRICRVQIRSWLRQMCVLSSGLIFASSHGEDCSATCHSTDSFRPLATPATQHAHTHTPSSVSDEGKAPLSPGADGIQYKGVMRTMLRALNLNLDCFTPHHASQFSQGGAALANFTSFATVRLTRISRRNHWFTETFLSALEIRDFFFSLRCSKNITRTRITI